MDKVSLNVNKWNNSNIQVFWGEIAPSDHLVQIYENDTHFLNTLEGFAGCGLLSGDSVIIIATQPHLNALNDRLVQQGFDIDHLIKTNQYFPLEAHQTLGKFLVNDWPEEALFNEFISSLLTAAKQKGRKVRAFGEMVAILWEQGFSGATVRLEHLWHQLHAVDNFSLYCAYPQVGFSRDTNDCLDEICRAHSKIIDGKNRPSTEIYYLAVS